MLTIFSHTYLLSAESQLNLSSLSFLLSVRILRALYAFGLEVFHSIHIQFNISFRLRLVTLLVLSQNTQQKPLKEGWLWLMVWGMAHYGDRSQRQLVTPLQQ